MRLQGVCALVTGAGSGIGRAIALRIAEEGADVAVNDVDAEAARSCAEAVSRLGRRCAAVVADVSVRSQVEQMVRDAVAFLGRIDVLVSNAGWDRLEPFVENTEETWERIIGVNFKAAIYCSRAVIDGMIEREKGKLLFIASDAGRVGSTGEVVYSGCKGGVIAFAKGLAREMARYKINVNVVCPGPTDTPLVRRERERSERNAKLFESLARAIPFRRMATVEEVAAAVVFLASSDADFITGQTLSVNGGLNML